VLRGRRAWIALAVLVVLLAGATLAIRSAIKPENLARTITAWVERELGATLTLEQAPALRLVPRLQLDLEGVRLERNDALLASVGELRIALPWSSLWKGGLAVESLSLRRPTIAWPALTQLLAELSDPDAPAQTPRLPRIAVGLRIEDGTLLSGPDDGDWRLDQVSILTTPLQDGEPFHIDAGARLRGGQARTVSLTLRGRPSNASTGLDLDELVGRIVISPDNRPLGDGMTIDLDGFVRVDSSGIGAAELAGRLPGWPDWLPNMLGYAPDQPVAMSLRRSAGEGVLVATLTQDDKMLSARLQAADLVAAAALADRPLAAMARLRGIWELDSLALGDVRLEGIRLEVAPVPVPGTGSGDSGGDRDGDAGADPDDVDGDDTKAGAAPAAATGDRAIPGEKEPGDDDAQRGSSAGR
jgi:hypothetical protein